MKRIDPLSVFVVLALAAGCGSDASETEPGAEPSQGQSAATAGGSLDGSAVQGDVRKMIAAVYDAEVDVVLGYTHPRIIEMMGGESRAQTTLKIAFASIQSTGMTLESLTFPTAPALVQSDVNQFVIVPTLSIVAAKDQRVESLNYQFGVRPVGETEWKYLEGSRVNKKFLGTFFPDFPTSYELPETYRKKL